MAALYAGGGGFENNKTTFVAPPTGLNYALGDSYVGGAALGGPVGLGTSRKRFLGAILGAEPDQRVVGTVATTVAGVLAGASVFRVHDVKPNFEALRVALAIVEGAPGA